MLRKLRAKLRLRRIQKRQRTRTYAVVRRAGIVVVQRESWLKAYR